MLPALIDFAEFVLDLNGLAVLAGPCQALAHILQLLLVLLRYTDLLLVVLGGTTRSSLTHRGVSVVHGDSALGYKR